MPGIPWHYFFWRFIYFYFMCTSVFACLSACVPCVYSAYGRYERILAPLELELETVVSYQMSVDLCPYWVSWSELRTTDLVSSSLCGSL